MTTPDEHSPDSPPPDAGRPTLDGMPPAWQFVYDRFREGHAAAVLGQIERPADPEALAILRASAAAVSVFRQAYEKASTASIATQIDGDGQDSAEGIHG